jgi:acetyltransferase-like isoleucine patch superfamily enzyme
VNAITKNWRNFKHRHKFAKVGKGCSFLGRDLYVEGHVELGDYCRIREGVRIKVHKGAKLIIGNRVLLSWNCIIEATESIVIRDNAGIGEFARVRDGAHLIYGTEAGWRYAPNFAEPIDIGEYAFIGSASFISHGVTVGKGAVVGAHAVVTKDIPEFEVWGGVPAKFIRHRTKDLPPHIAEHAAKLLEEQGIREDRRSW